MQGIALTAIRMVALCWLMLPSSYASEPTAIAQSVTRTAHAVATERSQKLASANGLKPMLMLDALDAASIETIAQRNQALSTLRQNGVARRASTPTLVTIHPDRRVIPESQVIRSVGDRLVWSARFQVEDAFAYRIALHQVNLPSGTLAWVYNQTGQELGPFVVDELIFEGTVWLPALNGEAQYLELALPAQRQGQATPASFEIGEVMQLLDLQATRHAEKTWQACDIPVACVDDSAFPATEMVRSATALLFFIKNGASFLCSGGLVASTGVQDEYLLTANHCFSTQREAATLSAYFDYYDGQCSQSGASPLGVLPQVHGARLRATGLESDFALVALNDRVPGIRSYLGWSTAPLDVGQALFRHAYPEGMTQRFSMSSVLDDTAQQCPGLAPPQFIFSQDLAGSTTGGSSGALLLNAEGLIVGQLLGACPLVSDYSPCRYDEFYNLDGAFSVTYPHVAQWLDPAAFFPDTTVADFIASVLNPAIGETVTLSVSVINQGLEPAPMTAVQWYRSADQVISPDDALLGEADVGPLQHEQSETVTHAVTLDSPGSSFFGVCVSALPTELALDNQCSDGVAVVVGHSDLQMVGLEVAEVEDGMLQLTATVENVGTIESGVGQVAFYSSADQQLDTQGTDHLLGERPMVGLAPGESTTVTLAIDWQPTTPQWLASCAGIDGLEVLLQNNCSEMTLPPLIEMTAEMMGVWALGDRPADSPGAGASLQLLGTDDGSGLLAGVVFDYLEGMPRWSVFTAALTGSTELDFELLNYAGGDFPPRFESDDVVAGPGIAAQLKFISPSAGFLQWARADSALVVTPIRRSYVGAKPSSSHGCRVGAYAFSTLEPGLPGHGLVAEVLQIGGVEHLALSWYAFVDGAQVFIVGVAPITDGESSMEAYWYRGSDGDPLIIEANYFGTMTFRATELSTVEFSWTSTAAQFSSGATDLVQISTIPGCQGQSTSR